MENKTGGVTNSNQREGSHQVIKIQKKDMKKQEAPETPDLDSRMMTCLRAMQNQLGEFIRWLRKKDGPKQK